VRSKNFPKIENSADWAGEMEWAGKRKPKRKKETYGIMEKISFIW